MIFTLIGESNKSRNAVLIGNSAKTNILMIKSVAEHLKITESTNYHLAAAKKIPESKFGGS